MRKLLNTLYITNENVYVSLDGENVVCKQDGKIIFRIPFDNLESIVCFSMLGCSPALMGKCVKDNIALSFVNPYSGKFLARACGETRGNIHMRINQIDVFRQNDIELSRNTIAAKFHNCIAVIKEMIRNKKELGEDREITNVIKILEEGIEKILLVEEKDTLMGIEGNCAHHYFNVYGKLFSEHGIGGTFKARNKRPPLDPVNAVLSFLYTMITIDYGSALETVGIDPYIGYLHSIRSNRQSLACDMVEESRCLAEKFVLTMFNLRILGEKDFDTYETGAVLLNDDGRRKVLTKWQEKKKTTIVHPYLKKKIALGLVPYVQANLLTKYLRGEIDEYQCFLL